MLSVNFVLVSFFISVTSLSASENHKVTYEHLYKAGVDAYLQNRWYDCIAFIEKALEDYFYYRSVVVQCRLQCQEKELFFLVNDTSNNRDYYLNFFETIVKKALCLSQCEKAFFKNRTRTSLSAENDFDRKVPYNYLQLCYYKTDDIVKAASCAYTFLVHNPNHEVMQSNLRYYLSVPGIKQTEIQYLEAEDYQELYLQGAHLYAEKQYKEVTAIMEKALQEYLLAERKCRLMCENSIPEFSDVSFYVAIASHFTFTLQCKLKCPEKLSFIYGQKHKNLFSSHYHYLQYSYYKTNQLEKACQAVASYLLLHPEDKTMLTNQAFYSKLDSVKPSWFSPRNETVVYHKTYSREVSLLQSVHKLFRVDINSPETLKFPIPPPGSADTSQLITIGMNQEKKFKKLSSSEINSWFHHYGITLHLGEKELNGTQRASFKNLATEKECVQLINLAKDGAVFGDGYNGKESPHTQFEMFEGLTVARAATLSQRGILNPEVVHLFLNISEKARLVVENFFSLETELYFAYTHLVCRTAFPDSPDERSDLSHPVHADNCILTPSGECLKRNPAYTWRDFSSIVYLNDDFEGGEFIFAKDKATVQASVKPSCGLMVAFSSGEENLHGVQAVRKGKRCALAMWYTLDPQHREQERDFALKVVFDLIEKRKLLKNEVTNLPSARNYKESVLNRFLGSQVDKPNIQESHKHLEL